MSLNFFVFKNYQNTLKYYLKYTDWKDAFCHLSKLKMGYWSEASENDAFTAPTTTTLFGARKNPAITNIYAV